MTSPNTNTAKNRPSKTDNANSNAQYSHELEEVVPGGRVSVFADTGKKYFVGVQLATLLKRETFNLYRSMKIKQVGISRATHAQVSFLVKAGAVRPGTHSVTLVDYETCHAFLREMTKKRRSEPDIVVPGKGMMDFENPGLKQRRSSSALPLTELQQIHRFYVPEAVPDFSLANREPVARHTHAWEPDVPVQGSIIYVREPEQPPPPMPTPALSLVPATGDQLAGRWYYRAQTTSAPSLYWPPVPAAAGAQPHGWSVGSGVAPPADQMTETRSLLERVEALTQQPPESDVDALQELASDL